VLRLQAGTPLWPPQNIIPPSGYVAVSPFPAGPRAVAVASLDELRGAMAAGTQHIVVKEHLDLTHLAEAGTALPVPTGTETIRVCMSGCALPNSCVPNPVTIRSVLDPAVSRYANVQTSLTCSGRLYRYRCPASSVAP
jgi:hypothetical protein